MCTFSIAVMVYAVACPSWANSPMHIEGWYYQLAATAPQEIAHLCVYRLMQQCRCCVLCLPWTACAQRLSSWASLTQTPPSSLCLLVDGLTFTLSFCNPNLPVMFTVYGNDHPYSHLLSAPVASTASLVAPDTLAPLLDCHKAFYV